MSTQFQAIFENGVLRPLQPVHLPEQQRVLVPVNTVGAEPSETVSAP